MQNHKRILTLIGALAVSLVSSLIAAPVAQTPPMGWNPTK